VLFGDFGKKWKLSGPPRGTAGNPIFPGVSEGCFLVTLGRSGSLVGLLGWGTAENPIFLGVSEGCFLVTLGRSGNSVDLFGGLLGIQFFLGFLKGAFW
jgi:hypothetical protein